MLGLSRGPAGKEGSRQRGIRAARQAGASQGHLTEGRGLQRQPVGAEPPDSPTHQNSPGDGGEQRAGPQPRSSQPRLASEGESGNSGSEMKLGTALQAQGAGPQTPATQPASCRAAPHPPTGKGPSPRQAGLSAGWGPPAFGPHHRLWLFLGSAAGARSGRKYRRLAMLLWWGPSRPLGHARHHPSDPQPLRQAQRPGRGWSAPLCTPASAPSSLTASCSPWLSDSHPAR